MKGAGFGKQGSPTLEHANQEKLVSSLDELLGQGKPEQILKIHHSKIEPDPLQPRRKIDEAGIKALSESIKLNGQAQPITVIPLGDDTYRIVAGERRWRAAKLADLEVVAYVRGDLDETQIRLIQVAENVDREDMTVEDTARAYVGIVNVLTESGLEKKKAIERAGISKTEFYRWQTINEAFEAEDSSIQIVSTVTADLRSLEEFRRLEKKAPDLSSKIIKKIQGDKLKGSLREEIDSLTKPKKKQEKQSPVSYEIENAELVGEEILVDISKGGKAKSTLKIDKSSLALLNGLFENE
ncbi:ParB/RepB/Spo0J family partition protein (plasmid) [Bermanella marisrubri]|uniref:Chromosome partitioning protein ParB n=1 Tax=Bermanella marisrubri TaxID=207949 RepID=Q1MY25_9GAMM|nr:ParB/RepB/Spo0J family partition protein [Bermanella marisrubri]EAT10871.1 chromosome partitioning protein ParB [Oceanobacter sp. RED65] [Bermanella marisrubri]QIZ85924.1 ParB/RepB/Spo0J family partition protein [Bermanella marisrubri]